MFPQVHHQRIQFLIKERYILEGAEKKMMLGKWLTFSLQLDDIPLLEYGVACYTLLGGPNECICTCLAGDMTTWPRY